MVEMWDIVNGGEKGIHVTVVTTMPLSENPILQTLSSHKALQMFTSFQVRYYSRYAGPLHEILLRVIFSFFNLVIALAFQLTNHKIDKT